MVSGGCAPIARSSDVVYRRPGFCEIPHFRKPPDQSRRVYKNVRRDLDRELPCGGAGAASSEALLTAGVAHAMLTATKPPHCISGWYASCCSSLLRLAAAPGQNVSSISIWITAGKPGGEQRPGAVT